MDDCLFGVFFDILQCNYINCYVLISVLFGMQQLVKSLYG